MAVSALSLEGERVTIEDFARPRPGRLAMWRRIRATMKRGGPAYHEPTLLELARILVMCPRNQQAASLGAFMTLYASGGIDDVNAKVDERRKEREEAERGKS